jgi:hypothetical protein
MAGLSSNEIALARAAKGTFTDFESEWVRQGNNAADAGIAYNKYLPIDPDAKFSPGKGSSGGGGYSDNIADPKGIAGWFKAGLSTQYKENAGMAPNEFQTLSSAIDLVVDSEGHIKNVGEILGGIAGDIGKGILLNFSQQNDLLMKINEETGMLGTLSRTFREEITEAYPHAIKLGISFDELSKSVTDLVANSGKFKLLGRETIQEMALASKFANSMSEYANMAGEFERVSLGISDMTRETNKAGMSSLAIGLNSRKTVKEVQENLKMLNTYGFKDGVEGLTKMVQKSIEFRLNMNAAGTLAEKVWDPDKALDFVANMQVIGGAMGDFNDPIKLMYMATNNVEGLQDAIIGASKSLVTYNNEQGRFEVTGANLRRAKAMADELGMSLTDLTTTAVASMERTQAASDLMGKGLNISEEDKEFLTNIAQMKGGKMVIEVPESLSGKFGEATEIALDGMTDELAQTLIGERKKLEGMTMEQIAMDQVSLIENINRDVSFITATMRIQAGKVGNAIANQIGYDPAAVAIEAAMLADKVHNKIDVDLVFDALNKQFGTNLSSKPIGLKSTPVEAIGSPTPTNTQNTTTTELKQPPVQRHTMDITVKSGDAMTEDIKRSIYSDQIFQSELTNSFLESFKRK